ncbi:uncharacterized protein ACUXST_000173 [Sphingomonas sp. F9_3S_D5_B_2]
MRKPSNETLRLKTPVRATVEAPGANENRGKSQEPERTCILTRRKGTKNELIRLALGPDGTVGPDVRARAPGRGAWIGADRGELDAANALGKLRSALQRAFKTKDVTVPADLGERTEHALRQGTLDRLGMEARSSNLLTGAERIEAAARSGKVHMLIHAADAGEDGCRRMDQAWRVGGGESQGVIFPEGRTILSMALGRENVVHVALTDPAAAARVRHALERWRVFTGPDRGLEGGEPALRTGSADEDLTKE